MSWRFFAVEVRGLQRLGPSFLRVTFGGLDLDRFADNGFDQRIKLAFPESEAAVRHLPDGGDWYARWRALPAELRSPIRTYTVREVRPHARELDVDVVLHGDDGPAARWARGARVGDRVAVLGPEAGFDGDHGGIGFRPPVGAGRYLLAGDETAVPAICAILERLPADAEGLAVLEVPHAADVQETAAPAGMTVRWLPRDDGTYGSRLVPAVRAAVDDGPPLTNGYVWLAGEAAMITALRRYLVVERGLDRGAVAFTGYWRLGRADVTAA